MRRIGGLYFSCAELNRMSTLCILLLLLFLALDFYRMISTHPGSLSRCLLAIRLAGQCRLSRRRAEHANDVQLIKEFSNLCSLRL